MCLLTLSVCMAVAGVAAGVGAGLGAALAPSVAAVSEAESNLKAAVTDLGGAGGIADLLVQQIQARTTRRALLLPGPSPPNPEETADSEHVLCFRLAYHLRCLQ